MSKKNLFIFTASFISLLGYMGATIYISFLPELEQVFQVSRVLIKLSITIYLVGVIVGIMLSAPLAEIFGRKRALLGFLLIFSTASLVCSFSSSIVWFLGGRFFQAIGNAAGPILVMASITDRYKGMTFQKIMAYLLIMSSLGPGISPILGSVVLHFFKWQVVFYLFTGLGLLALTLILPMNELQPNKRKSSTPLHEYLIFLKHPFFRYYCFMIGALYGAYYALIVISSYIFRLYYGWRVIDFVWVGLVIAFANSLGIVADEEFIKRITVQKVLLIGISIVGISLFLLFFIGLPSLSFFFLLMITLFAMGQNLTSSCLTTSAMKLIPGFTDTGSSLLRFSKDLIAVAALLLVPFLPETLTVLNSFILCAFLICLLGYFQIRHSFKKLRKPPPTAQ